MDVEERKEIFDILETRSINFVPHTFDVGAPILEWASSFEKIDAEELKSEKTPSLMSEESPEDKARMEALLAEEKEQKKESDYTKEEQEARQEEVQMLYKPLLGGGTDSDAEPGLGAFDEMFGEGARAEQGGAFNLASFDLGPGGGVGSGDGAGSGEGGAENAIAKTLLMTAATIEIGDDLQIATDEGTPVTDQGQVTDQGGAEATPAADAQDAVKKSLSKEDKAKEKIRKEVEQREKEAAMRKSPSGEAGGSGGGGDLLIKEGNHNADNILAEIESSAVDSSAVASVVGDYSSAVGGSSATSSATSSPGPLGIDGGAKPDDAENAQLQEVGLDGLPKKRPSKADSESKASETNSKTNSKTSSKQESSKKPSKDKDNSKNKADGKDDGEKKEGDDDDGASVNTPYEAEEGPVMVGLPMFAESMHPTPCVSAGDPDPDCMFLPALDEVFIFLHR